MPDRVLRYLANQIDVDPDTFSQYATRETTRWEHMREIKAEYGYHPFTLREYRPLAKALLPQAMEKDYAIPLIHWALDWLRERKSILPAISTVERLVWETRRRAEESIYRLLNAALTPDQKQQLDKLIGSRMESEKTPLGWIKEDPGQSSPRACKKAIDQRNQILALGLEIDTRGIHPQRLRQLARLGRNYDPHAFRRFPEAKRYAILVAYLLELCQDITDQIIEISRRQIANLHANGRKTQDEIQKQNGKALDEKIVRFVDLTTVLLEAKKKGQDLDEAIASSITWEQLAQDWEEAQELTRPANYDYLDLVKNRYNYLRQYTPTFLDAMQFRSTQAAAPLLEAVDVIRELNQSGKRKVTENAPLDFLSDRWLPYVVDDRGRINKVYYEMATMTELHNRIRSGDVSVVGSRQHKDFEEYLVPKDEWEQVGEPEPTGGCLPFLLDYVSDKALRRRVQRGLNKGESMNSLARAIFFGKRGELRERALNDQLQRASALSLLINAISIWNTVYLTKAVEVLRKTRPIPEPLLSHISPLGWNHINFLGEYKFPLDQVPGLNNLRPLNPLGG
ncbi:Transposase and inactivated derivatives, TnpA family [Melghirimyces thermohalophilus]|uniref:Transposase and inactivated derivatives, TnpA family n=1 Tax=Melghirimyces thermohalophilus TaxID=1236220 RepID=A0A1G6LWT6_9BACL|nr:Transposase and inactivated derivatives, TnpA family [Melghirimyces thermohalophilus]